MEIRSFPPPVRNGLPAAPSHLDMVICFSSIEPRFAKQQNRSGINTRSNYG
jgi:hypothetical protein